MSWIQMGCVAIGAVGVAIFLYGLFRSIPND
jgi:hypothetical protein